MFRPLAFFIGARYMRARQRSQFVSFISLTSMIGLTLGVLAMIVVLSVMNGFQQEMSRRILGMVPHATLSQADGLADWRAVGQRALAHPQVTGVAPFAELEGMLSYRGSMQPVQIEGVDPAEEPKVSIIASQMREGALADLKPGEFGVVLGEIVARRFGLKLGDRLTLIVPEPSSAPGGITPRMQRLTLVGTFRVGAELDGSLALIHVADASQILRLPGGHVQSLRLATSDLYQAPRIAGELVEELGADFHASDWTQTQGSLFAAMRMEKTMIGLLLMLIIAVAAFNIVATLIMVVSDKRSDIAILRTLGATPGEIMAVFMVQGSLIGIAGTLLGGVMGVLAALNVSAIVAWIEKLAGHHIFSSDVYFISSLPSELEVSDVAMICCAGLVLSFLATLYPAWRASRTEPAEALRYE